MKRSFRRIQVDPRIPRRRVADAATTVVLCIEGWRIILRLVRGWQLTRTWRGREPLGGASWRVDDYAQRGASCGALGAPEGSRRESSRT